MGTSVKFLFFITLLLFQGCVAYGEKKKVSLQTETKIPEGTSVKIKGSGVDTELVVNSKTASQIIAAAASNISLLMSGTFELILSSASVER